MCSSHRCQVAVWLVAQFALVELRKLIRRLVVPVLHGLASPTRAAWLVEQNIPNDINLKKWQEQTLDINQKAKTNYIYIIRFDEISHFGCLHQSLALALFGWACFFKGTIPSLQLLPIQTFTHRSSAHISTLWIPLISCPDWTWSVHIFIIPQTVWPHWGVLPVTVKARCSIEVVSGAFGIFPVNFRTKASCDMSICISTAQVRTKCWRRD